MAGSIMRELQGIHIPSLGSVRSYEQALKNVAVARAQQGKHLRDLTPKCALSYLEQRAEEVGQKSLDMERQAIQHMFWHVSLQLPVGETLKVVKSEYPQILLSRAYTYEQIQAIAANQKIQNSLATYLAYYAGLRASELLTLLPVNERSADKRVATLKDKFIYREGLIYTVIGKGGLIREVLIPYDLAQQLEERRLERPIVVTDRKIYYRQHYNLQGGRNWSQSFSQASKNILNWSHGAHGVRHSYAQERMDELRSNGFPRDKALEIVSQELGHFRSNIVETYLR